MIFPRALHGVHGRERMSAVSERNRVRAAAVSCSRAWRRGEGRRVLADDLLIF
jgi:hypothetical protein